MTRRIEQVDSFIQAELNKIFINELELPSSTLVTITKVETTKDLGQSKIYLSIFPIDQQETIIKIIKKQTNHLRYLLSKKFQGYHLPRLEFILDDSLLKQRKVEREIEQIYHQDDLASS